MVENDHFRPLLVSGAVLTAANLGDDADTTVAIAGQLAGALGGIYAIPDEWLATLAWRDKIDAMADHLLADDLG